MMMDRDHFKSINDRYGHLFGDLVLKNVATAISETLREYDIAGRYGGEEFAVLAPGTSSGDLVSLAERIRQTVEQLEIQNSSAIVHVTVSVGVAALDEHDSLETLLERADNALYQAKHEGRNRVVVDILS